MYFYFEAKKKLNIFYINIFMRAFSWIETYSYFSWLLIKHNIRIIYRIFLSYPMSLQTYSYFSFRSFAYIMNHSFKFIELTRKGESCFDFNSWLRSIKTRSGGSKWLGRRIFLLSVLLFLYQPLSPACCICSFIGRQPHESQESHNRISSTVASVFSSNPLILTLKPQVLNY